MDFEITSAPDLVEFIQSTKKYKLVIEFKAEWCAGSSVMRTPMQKFAVKYSRGNFKFASIDVDEAGLQNLNSSRRDLKLGAIPAFYIYEDNTLVDKLITCSFIKLDNFLNMYYDGLVIHEIEKDNYKKLQLNESDQEENDLKSRKRTKKKKQPCFSTNRTYKNRQKNNGCS